MITLLDRRGQELTVSVIDERMREIKYNDGLIARSENQLDCAGIPSKEKN